MTDQHNINVNLVRKVIFLIKSIKTIIFVEKNVIFKRNIKIVVVHNKMIKVSMGYV